MHRQIRGQSSSRSIAELAARQHGVVARRQLALLGLGEDAHSGHQPETKGGDVETAFLDFVERCGLPRPTMNEPLGPYFPDALWPNERVIVELDSYGIHATRQSFERDRARDRALTLAGYSVLRITWRQLTADAGAIAAQLSALLR